MQATHPPNTRRYERDVREDEAALMKKSLLYIVIKAVESGDLL